MDEDLTTTTTVGNLAAGTTISQGTGAISIIKDMVWSDVPPEPSTEYESKQVEQYGTWSSTTDVDNFFNTYSWKTGFAGLKIGNYVTINDGTYNKQWVIAGFNLEHNQTASDGTTYDNGYGIVMIPREWLTTYNWHYTSSVTPYTGSAIHSYINGTVYNALNTICGSHIVQRNVLLGSACTGTSPRSWTTSAYTWTTAYLTLMSVGQMAGSSYFGNYNNQYDDGEANYHLPLFDHEDYYSSSYYYWTRNVYGYYSSYFYAWRCLTSGSFNGVTTANTCGVRPLMYLR